MKKSNQIIYRIGQPGGFVLNKKMKSYHDHPYFIKKAEKAKESLLRAGGMPAILRAFGLEPKPAEKKED